MEKLHVMITVPVEKTHVEMIAAVDPRVEVRYATEEVRAELGIASSSILTLYPHIAQRQLTSKEASEALDRMLADTDIIFGWRLPLNPLSRAPRLKWVQGIGAGVDLLTAGTNLMQSDVTITGSRGIRSTAMAEFTICLILMLAKNAPRLVADQQAHLWKPFTGLQLNGRTVGIVGLGSIGSEVARLCKAFGMRVLASKRSATRKQKDAAGADEIFRPNELLQMLPQCDFVILTTPLTSETRGLIGEAEFKAMKPTAYIINVARGPVVKQGVLIQALKKGWIGGAALDVFESEPLAPDSELWELPNVIISPHIAGHREQNPTPLTELFCENLRRFLAGRELLNVAVFAPVAASGYLCCRCIDGISSVPCHND